MDLHIYNRGGGTPLCSSATTITLVGTDKTETVVAAVVGKKIIPRWIIAATDAFGTRPVKIDLKSGTTEIFVNLIQNQLTWPMFLELDDVRDKIGVWENLRVKAYGSADDIYNVTIGYYLI